MNEVHYEATVWTVKGANAIIALRCSRLSGLFEDFWNAAQSESR